MSTQFSWQQAEGLPELPSQTSDIVDGQYVIKCTEELVVSSDNAEVKAETWFQSPPLDVAAISRINSLQLFAESHDQGYADELSEGNWTWFELAILENEHSSLPRVKDGIKLVWLSHYNRFSTATYGWNGGEGKVFGAHHDLLRLLENGNVISIRLCARFRSWKIAAKTGYLIFDLGQTIDDREPLSYGHVVSEIKTINEVFTQVNAQAKTAFQPTIPKSIFRADAITTREARPLRVLSLDGGGVRGLSTLYLLKAVMDNVNPGKKPCEVFDLIGGTSTGGLIAIMLGRLEMGIQQCIDVYQEFMGKVFDPKERKSDLTVFAGTPRFVTTTSVLETVIKELVKKAKESGSAEDKLYDESSKCKVFVMAVQKDAANNREPAFLRSYKNTHSPSLLPDIKIWEAARATSAAPSYFPSLKVGGYELVDGGLGANNPLGWLWNEILTVYGPARNSDCFLSLGTGIEPNSSLNYINPLAWASIVANTEIIHILFRTLINAYAPKAMTKKYWRLNVSEKDGETYKKVGELDDLEALKTFTKMTETYLGTQEVKQMIQEITAALNGHAGSK